MKKALYGAILALVFITGAPLSSSAEVIISQPVKNASNLGDVNGFMYQTLGTGLNFFPNSLEISVTSVQNGVLAQATMWQCTSGSTSTTTQSVGCVLFATSTITTINNTVNEPATFTFTGASSTNPLRFYDVRVDRTGGATCQAGFPFKCFAHGSDFDSYITGQAVTDGIAPLGTVRDYYFIFDGVAVATTTRFVTLTPANNTTTASTSVNFFIEYFYNSTSGIFNEVGYEVYRLDDNFSLARRVGFTINEGQNAISTSFSFPINGAYQWRAFMKNSTNNSALYSAFTTFYTVSNPYPSLIGVDIGSTFALATSTCSFSNITGCFQNALIFAFYPSQESINNFITLKNEISQKPPFGYVTAITSQLSALSGTASSTFVLQLEPNIRDNIITPARTATASILFLFFGVWFYNRVRKIDI